MTLYPSEAGFGAEARDAAAWIAAQALIALENARLHGLVQRQAVTDELTGLANRRKFLAQLDAEIARSRRSGSPLGLVLADLDDFKRVNDTYGHEVGDVALQSFAEIMGTVARDVDLPVRLGGEEFAVLLPDTDLAGATLLAERLRFTLESTAIGWPATTSGSRRASASRDSPQRQGPRICSATPTGGCTTPSGAARTGSWPRTRESSARIERLSGGTASIGVCSLFALRPSWRRRPQSSSVSASSGSGRSTPESRRSTPARGHGSTPSDSTPSEGSGRRAPEP